MKWTLTLACVWFFGMMFSGRRCFGETEPNWPAEVQEIRYLCKADGTMQPAMFYKPAGVVGKVPLLVALHTWSGNYKQKMSVPYAKSCIERGWVFIHPHFRGPNWTPQAAGSEMVIADILDAVEYAKANAPVDPNRIYLVGASGGGYTALLMAGRAPEVWAGVSAWASITDLRAWYFQCKKAGRRYVGHMLKACGGAPGDSKEVDREYRKRSPLTYLEKAKGVALDINAGIRDGHTGSVPVSHSLRAFNVVAEPKDRICEEDIEFFVEKGDVPVHLKSIVSDPSYGAKQPLFRRSSGKARITIFDGGHEIIFDAAFGWLSKQRKGAAGH